MKIRLMGPTDLVRAWARELERAYDLTASEYPSRSESETRVYFDLDDRLAASIVGMDGGNESVKRGSKAAPVAPSNPPLSPSRALVARARKARSIR